MKNELRKCCEEFNVAWNLQPPVISNLSQCRMLFLEFPQFLQRNRSFSAIVSIVFLLDTFPNVQILVFEDVQVLVFVHVHLLVFSANVRDVSKESIANDHFFTSHYAIQRVSSVPLFP